MSIARGRRWPAQSSVQWKVAQRHVLKAVPPTMCFPALVFGSGSERSPADPACRGAGPKQPSRKIRSRGSGISSSPKTWAPVFEQMLGWPTFKAPAGDVPCVDIPCKTTPKCCTCLGVVKRAVEKEFPQDPPDDFPASDAQNRFLCIISGRTRQVWSK